MPTPGSRPLNDARLPSHAAGRTRPHDRRQRVLAAAAELFWRRGYHQVAMADIAAEVGITAGALYRHVSGKQDLLAAVLREALGDLDMASAPTDLDEMIDRLVRRGLERREFTSLWEREKRDLSAVDREVMSARIRAIEARVVTALNGSYPHETPEALDLRAGAVLAVAESPSYQRFELESAHVRDLLCSVASAVAGTDMTGTGDLPLTMTGGGDPQSPVSRRETLLWAAIRLFAEHGYPNVSLTDIGSATGITGPSIYGHFETKDDVLAAGLQRGSEALWLMLHDALAGADGPFDALDRALRRYVLFAAAHPELLSVILIEAVHLPAERRARYDRAQQDFTAEWVALIRRARPELTLLDARVLVGACLALPNALLRDKRLRYRPNLAGEVEACARTVLAVPVSEPRPHRP